jgi:hypothetical protein
MTLLEPVSSLYSLSLSIPISYIVFDEHKTSRQKQIYYIAIHTGDPPKFKISVR